MLYTSYYIPTSNTSDLDESINPYARVMKKKPVQIIPNDRPDTTHSVLHRPKQSPVVRPGSACQPEPADGASDGAPLDPLSTETNP